MFSTRLHQLRPQRALPSTLRAQSRSLSLLSIARRVPRVLSPTAIPVSKNAVQLLRRYAQGPGGGAGGGFPGFAGFKPQHQKGEALKEYVSSSL